jgi:hypothetical protein
MANDINIHFKIDSKALDYFQRELPNKLVEARKNAVTAAGMVWADEAKLITRNEGHIKTGLYVNSIGYKTGSPATDDDVIYDLSQNGSKTILKTGSNVAYAGRLEKLYNILARALDTSENRMKKVAIAQIKDTLFG